MRTVVPTTDYAAYSEAWDAVVQAGRAQWNLDTRAGDHRYLSLVALAVTQDEFRQLRDVVEHFGRLIDSAVSKILEDCDWWSALAWPWAAIELARQESPHPAGCASLFGRFDCLLDEAGNWRVIEYNADTPSGGREASGLEPAVAQLHPGLHRSSAHLLDMLGRTFEPRVAAGVVGIVSSHRWVEDMAQAHWLAAILRGNNIEPIVGDVHDLTVERRRIYLRGRRIDALYRFYPIERLYRHAIFAGLCEAALDGRLILLNGLRGFLAQSKACLAWLWSNRRAFDSTDCARIERHLPETLIARDSAATALLPDGVLKHVNGREGDSVVFGNTLNTADWEDRLLEGGYVVQRVIRSPGVVDVEVDDLAREVRCIGQRVACVGGFNIGGRFAGCYTRLDGAITSPRATFVATLLERGATKKGLRTHAL